MERPTPPDLEPVRPVRRRLMRLAGSVAAAVLPVSRMPLAATASLGAAATARAAPRPVLLVFGDSLSAEYGLRRGTGWVSLLGRRLEKEGLGLEVVNASVSGETTAGGLSRLPALLARHRPAVVVIELGANDALRGLSLDAMRANLSSMTRQSREVGARVLLAGMKIPPNYGRAYGERFEKVYADVAARDGASLVPFFLEGVVEREDWFQADRIHPTEQAQPRMLDNVWPRLAPLVRQAATGTNGTGSV